jgi:hypothetical protein
MNSDFGIKNEVDYLVNDNTIDIYDCRNGLMFFSREYFKNPIHFKFGIWYKNQQIKSFRNSGDCCFKIKRKFGKKVLPDKEVQISQGESKSRVKIPGRRKYKGKYIRILIEEDFCQRNDAVK